VKGAQEKVKTSMKLSLIAKIGAKSKVWELVVISAL